MSKFYVKAMSNAEILRPLAHKAMEAKTFSTLFGDTVFITGSEKPKPEHDGDGQMMFEVKLEGNKIMAIYLIIGSHTNAGLDFHRESALISTNLCNIDVSEAEKEQALSFAMHLLPEVANLVAENYSKGTSSVLWPTDGKNKSTETVTIETTINGDRLAELSCQEVEQLHFVTQEKALAQYAEGYREGEVLPVELVELGLRGYWTS